ncbi:MAG TPA: hypothetical protein VFG20_09945 [Planctomycetaceae bacterium]|nr:hypothetical protein [Planctomycetaceae bacterium]
MTRAAMPCWEALELLEGIDAGAITADDPLSIDAQRHLAECAGCQKTLPRRLKWNAGLTAAFTAVDVPAELESRLAQQFAAVPSTPVVTPAAPSRSRRRGIIAAVTVAALVLLVLWQQPWSSREELLTERTVEANIGCELSQLTVYTSSRWQPELPMSWRAFFELRADLVYAFPPEQSRPAAALVPFSFSHPSLERPILGRLVMVPVSRFHDPPTATDFSFARIGYVAGYSHCAWTEGKWVYLCYVRSVGGAEMGDLRRLMLESRNIL